MKKPLATNGDQRINNTPRKIKIIFTTFHALISGVLATRKGLTKVEITILTAITAVNSI